MKREEVLAAAQALITRDRAESYGDAQENFARIAAIWTAILDTYIRPEQVALMRAGLKIARLAHDSSSSDGWLDGVGYLALGAEMATKE